MKPYPTQAELCSLFDYVEGELYYRTAPAARRVIGDRVGSIDPSTGYRIVKIKGTRYKAHRLIWVYVYGHLPVGTVDHINGVRDDNTLLNLRDVDRRTNTQNQMKASAASTTGVLGVYWSETRNGFMASVSVLGKKKRRGPYKTVERAALAYVELKRLHHAGCTL